MILRPGRWCQAGWRSTGLAGPCPLAAPVQPLGRSIYLNQINSLRKYLLLVNNHTVLPFAPMSRWFCILLLACATAAHAAPQGTNSDDMDRLLAEKGLFTRLEDVGHKVADKAQNVAGRAGDLVVNAMGFLGVPYKRGGNSAETGFDCSGFVRAIYEQTVGLMLPRRADQQAAATQVIDKKELQPGDLVFFNTMRRNFSHVGIYVGDNKFIHSPRSGSEIRVEDMGLAYWARRFNGARRVAQTDGVESSAQASQTPR